MAEYKLTSLFSYASDVIVITIGARRSDGQHITDAQKDAAMNAAKATLQIVGADVEANSTGILSKFELNDGDKITVSTTVDASVLAGGDGVAAVDASVDEIPEYDGGEGAADGETELPEYDPENPTDGQDDAE